MIEKFKDKLKSLKIILNEIKNLKLLREQDKNEIKYETKRKLNMLDDEINDILGKLDADLRKCKFFDKAYDFQCVEKERE